jgi:hypothetical protein
VPSRIYIFLWLLANNKTLTRDNLEKRRELNDKICLFCTEVETISHLFYECCVAKRIWEVMAEITDVPLITDFESMAKWWIRGEKCNPDNVIYAVVLSSLWKLKISLCFQGDGVRRLLVSCTKLMGELNTTEQLRRCCAAGDLGRELEVRGTRRERAIGLEAT